MMSFNFKYFMFSFGFIVMSHVRMSTFFTQANTIKTKYQILFHFQDPETGFCLQTIAPLLAVDILWSTLVIIFFTNSLSCIQDVITTILEIYLILFMSALSGCQRKPRKPATPNRLKAARQSCR